MLQAKFNAIRPCGQSAMFRPEFNAGGKKPGIFLKLPGFLMFTGFSVISRQPESAASGVTALQRPREVGRRR